MALTLFLHPLASFCHKVLIPLYENGTPFTPVIADDSLSAESAALLERWPVGKIPVLYDSDTDELVGETSIIIEYLQARFPGPVPMLPADPEVCREVRLWDRFFDLYVSVPMQKIVTDRIRPAGSADPHGVTEAHDMLTTAYRMLESRLAGRQWAVGDSFSMADCAALPALFYASIVQRFGPDQPALATYLDRLLQRPSVIRTLDEAAPWFRLFPYREAMPPHYPGAAP